MKKIITYGTFDLLHYGHINLLKRARELGDHLTVAVSTDEFNSGKGKKSFHSYSNRVIILEALKFVDRVIPENNWEQKKEDIIKYKIDTFVIGDDWRGKFDFLKSLCNVVYLERTPGISTTDIKTKILINKW